MSVGGEDRFTSPLTDAEELQRRDAVNKTGLCCMITAVGLRGKLPSIMQTLPCYLLLYRTRGLLNHTAAQFHEILDGN